MVRIISASQFDGDRSDFYDRELDGIAYPVEEIQPKVVMEEFFMPVDAKPVKMKIGKKLKLKRKLLK